MNQQELEARLAQLAAGGDPSTLRHSPTASRKRIKNPQAAANGGPDAEAPAEIDVVVQAWEDPETGARLEAYVGPDGSYVIEKDTPGTKTPAASGTRSTAAGADPNTPQGRKALEDERESVWNRDTPISQGGSGLYETHAVRREREARERREAPTAKPPTERVNPADPTRRQTWNPQAGNGQGAWEDAGPIGQKPEDAKPPTERVNPSDPTRRQVWNPRANAGKGAWEDAGTVAEKSEIRQIDGEDVEVIRDPATGRITSVKPIAAGTPTTAGPSMPVFVRGQSAEALRKYREALNAAVAAGTLSPAQASKRWEEAKTIANQVVNEATIEQREREAARNTEVNLATTKLTHMRDGLSSALEFVSKLNGKLPEGSDLGAKAFVAFMGLQMLQMERSGINSIGAGTPTQQPPLPTLTTADITNPAALEAKRQEIAAQTAAAANPPPAPAAQPAASGAAAPSVPGASPPPPTEAAPVPAPASTAGGPAPIPGDLVTVRHTVTGATSRVPRTSWEMGQDFTNKAEFELVPAAAPPPPEQAVQQMAPAEDFPVLAQYQQPAPMPVTPTGVWEEHRPTAPPPPGATYPLDPRPSPRYDAEGIERTNDLLTPAPGPVQPPPVPVTGVPDGTMMRAPLQDFPALAPYRQPAIQPAQPAGPTPPALLRAKALATVPWRISEAEYLEMRSAGISDDEILSIPQVPA